MCTGFGTVSGFSHPLGSWPLPPRDKEGLLYGFFRKRQLDGGTEAVVAE